MTSRNLQIREEEQRLVICVFIKEKIITNIKLLIYVNLYYVILRAYNPRGIIEVRQALENVNKVEDLLPIMKVNQNSSVFHLPSLFAV